ncbi:hypothetical protein R3I93_009555 [Phoxinus phoxinus]|uniref:Uncharacterized protein n=1 Tax=Phoxinus phoxinus TaxID=58324 RepID=A0AAN9H7Z0_9TELE
MALKDLGGFLLSGIKAASSSGVDMSLQNIIIIIFIIIFIIIIIIIIFIIIFIIFIIFIFWSSWVWRTVWERWIISTRSLSSGLLRSCTVNTASRIS